MSICLPENSTAFEKGRPLVPSWRSLADVVLHHSLGRLRRLLIAWRARQSFRSEVRDLSERLLRDVDLDVVARREPLTPFWRGHTPR